MQKITKELRRGKRSCIISEVTPVRMHDPIQSKRKENKSFVAVHITKIFI